MELKWLPLLLIPVFAVYIFTGDSGYPRRGVKEWFAFWGLYWLQTAIPISILVRNAGEGLMVSLLVTGVVLAIYYRMEIGKSGL